MKALYTRAQLEQLEAILYRLVDEEVPTPVLNPKPGEDGWSADSMLRDLATRGYLTWWLVIQVCDEDNTDWQLRRLSRACWMHQSAYLLWALREQADAVGKPDSGLKDAYRPAVKWKDVGQIVLELAEAGEFGTVGTDLHRWASSHGVALDDITAAAVRELEKSGADHAC